MLDTMFAFLDFIVEILADSAFNNGMDKMELKEILIKKVIKITKIIAAILIIIIFISAICLIIYG